MALAQLGHIFMRLGQNEESLKYFKKWIYAQKGFSGITLYETQRIAYEYWVNGYKKEAQNYFNKHIQNCLDEIKLGRARALIYYSSYDLAGIYAFLGQKDKAYENLRTFNRIQVVPIWLLRLLKTDPLFDSIKNESEFQKIVNDVEVKYQTQHERVRNWIEELGML
jgi:tetratricopeptide (TPR) repeat protein